VEIDFGEAALFLAEATFFMDSQTFWLSSIAETFFFWIFYMD
jgi:hypothetical protein